MTAVINIHGGADYDVLIARLALRPRATYPD
jgi:hypothetical protein